MKLSDAFITKSSAPPLELRVTVKNINLDKNLILQKSCATLKQYGQLMELIKKYGNRENPKSYQKVIELAIQKGILPEYLERKNKEVSNMLTAKYSYKDDLEVHMMEARKLALIEGKIETAQNLLMEGDSIEKVTRCTGISIEKIAEIAKNLPTTR